MTGTIVQLATTTRSGIIRAEDGCRVFFSASTLLGEFDALAVGHRVRFDFDHAWSQATAVRALREPASCEAPLDLRYMGFDQAQNVRQYKFNAIANGHATRRFVVTVDVALFLKHRVTMQEGPALCLRKLISDLETSPKFSRHELGNDDLLAYASARAAAVHRKARPKPCFDRRRRCRTQWKPSLYLHRPPHRSP